MHPVAYQILTPVLSFLGHFHRCGSIVSSAFLNYRTNPAEPLSHSIWAIFCARRKTHRGRNGSEMSLDGPTTFALRRCQERGKKDCTGMWVGHQRKNSILRAKNLFRYRSPKCHFSRKNWASHSGRTQKARPAALENGRLQDAWRLFIDAVRNAYTHMQWLSQTA